MSAKRCATCGRELVPFDEADPDDMAMDCGGDCLGCILRLESESL